ncbi:opa3 domain-containing protein [Diplodia corticola]|uniref:Opa3 domain-containing protein n=1 Tax=Diplodia corticola TaxID=236234 RepID=A0A1J9QLY8_9PEZI|nr:opa3 domain-containing protein [Diplodia corticola]OJD29473.1 opa3 domain-containing protein [Diplodia corticola]
MFCTTLHRRKSFSSAIPALTVNPGLNLREYCLNTHDLALPLPRQGSADVTRTLRVLLLSPTCAAPSALPATLTRIQHFAALNGGMDSIIMFLLNPDSSAATTHTSPHQPGQQHQQQQRPQIGLHAYAHLTSTLLTDPSLSALPLLPLPSTPSLTPILQTYIRTNSAARAARRVQERKNNKSTTTIVSPSTTPPSSTFNTALDLLPWCTADSAAAPLGRDVVFRLTDLFGSLREVAAVAVAHGSGDGDGDDGLRAKVEEMVLLVGERTAGDVLDFWVEEWVAD